MRATWPGGIALAGTRFDAVAGASQTTASPTEEFSRAKHG